MILTIAGIWLMVFGPVAVADWDGIDCVSAVCIPDIHNILQAKLWMRGFPFLQNRILFCFF